MKNKQNGITLIALIITIIVMLILVAVTINVALNGGLFTKANNAKVQTNLAKEKELLQTKALGYLNNDGYVDLAEYVSKESPLEGYTLTNNTNYVTASNGTSTFYITKQGGITETEPTVAGYSFTIEDLFKKPYTMSERGKFLISKTDFLSLIGATQFEDILNKYAVDLDGDSGKYTFDYDSSYGNKIEGWFSVMSKFLNGNEQSGDYYLDIEYGRKGDKDNIWIVINEKDSENSITTENINDFIEDAVDEQGNSIQITLVTNERILKMME